MSSVCFFQEDSVVITLVHFNLITCKVEGFSGSSGKVPLRKPEKLKTEIYHDQCSFGCITGYKASKDAEEPRKKWRVITLDNLNWGKGLKAVDGSIVFPLVP